MKQVLVGLAFVGIIGSMVSALVFMMRRDPPGQHQDPRRAKRMVKALALRVGISVLLFVCILIAWKLGYIQPTGLPVGG